MTILKSLEAIILTEVAPGIGKTSIDYDEDLLEQGVIDSLGLVKLITSLEKAFGINIDDEDLVPDNFQTVNAIARLIEPQLKVN